MSPPCKTKLETRASVDLDLLSTDTLYGMSAAEKDRAANFVTTVTSQSCAKNQRGCGGSRLFAMIFVYRLETFALEAARLGAELQISAIETEGFFQKRHALCRRFCALSYSRGRAARHLLKLIARFIKTFLSALDENSLDAIC